MSRKLLHEAFADAAAKSPGALAVVADGGALTYAELEARADAVAASLRAIGVSSDTLVATHLEPGLDLVTAVVGILKAGGAYLPLDVTHPIARVRELVRRARPACILGRRDTPLHVESERDARPVVEVAIDDACLGARGRPAAPRDAPPDQALAYCLFTSGTTGAPKGVQVSHESVTSLLDAWRERWGTPGGGGGFAASQWTSPGFDISVFELFLPLTSGGTVHLVPRRLRADSAGLLRWMSERRIQLAYLPAFFVRWLSEQESTRLTPLALELALVGVEPILESQLHRLSRSLPRLRIVNGYGPTETTVFSTAYDRIRDLHRNAPIGRPIANARVHILDDAGGPTAPGIAGEIHVAGLGVARGYLGDPALTADRFVPDPFGAPGARMYRTGDLGRYLPDGDIEFLGRRDRQVKIRGHRIELAEVEASLARCRGAREVAVAARPDRSGDLRLVGYVVRQSDADLTSAALRDEVALLLPEHMVPSAIVVLEALPRTANGKVDVEALPDGLDAASRPNVAPPRTPTEKLLAGIWAGVLGVDRVGIDEGFRSLGGTSMQTIQVQHRLEHALGRARTIPPQPPNATIAEYSRLVDEAPPAEERAPAMAAAGASYAQEQVWFLEQTGEAWRAYRFHARLDLSGDLDIRALQRALDQLVERHDILRTAFEVAEGQLRRRVLPRVRATLPLIDLSDLPEPQRGQELDAAIARELAAPFDTAHPPLVRWLLMRRSPREHVLVQSEHHYVHDGQAFRILVRELAELYTAARLARAPALPPVGATYGDHVAAEKAWLASPDFSRQVAAWVELLRGSTQGVPFRRERAKERRYVGAQVRRALRAELCGELGSVAATLGVSRFAMAFAAFGVLLARHGRSDRFVVGTALANRPSERLESVVGMFVNMVPIPHHVQREDRFSDVVRALADRIDFAVRHGGVPVAEMVKRLDAGQRRKGEAPFNVAFSFHDSVPLEHAFAGLEVTVEEGLPNGSAKFDLNVVGVSPSGTGAGALEMVFEYDADLFDRATVDRMVDQYTCLLDAVARSPTAMVSELPLQSPADRHEAVVRWNDTALPVPDRTCIHHLFEAQAARTPDAVAVACGAEQIRYAELDHRANQLARRLAALGVAPERLAGVCLERTVDLVVALLAIWKAGGGYVPLDPAYPPERLAYMLQDSGARVVLSHRALAARLPAGAARVVCLDDEASLLAREAADPPPVDARPESLAYCIYTSGSTGKPKGVALQHSSGVAFLAWARRTFDARQLVRVVCSTSICFDLSVFELFAPLSTGGTVVLVKDAMALADGDAARGATLLNTVPSALRALLDAGALPAGLDTLNLAGEALPRALVDLAFALSPSLRVYNLYGPSEATTYSTSCEIDRDRAAPVTIGRPVGNTQVYILDEDGEPAAVGVPGEIHIGGAGLARGYLNRPELTAERFVPDPFGVPGARMYRTGDLGRFRPDGQVDFLGRLDHQVKIRGHRIELGEIESALLACPGVGAAAVVAREDSRGETRLVAHVAPSPNASPSSERLRATLRRTLPEYMVPSAFVTLEALPLNPSGKIDRKALQDRPLEAPPEVIAPPPAPGAGVTGTIIEIMNGLVPGGPFAADDLFFDAGFHSIDLMRLVARCRKTFEVPLTIAEALGTASPSELAALIERRAGGQPP